MKKKINNVLKGISVFHSANLLLRVLQIKDISAFEGIFKGLYNDKTAIIRCSFGGMPVNDDFKPFLGGLRIYM